MAASVVAAALKDAHVLKVRSALSIATAPSQRPNWSGWKCLCSGAFGWKCLGWNRRCI